MDAAGQDTHKSALSGWRLRHCEGEVTWPGNDLERMQGAELVNCVTVLPLATAIIRVRCGGEAVLNE